MGVVFFGNERLATGTTTDCSTLKALINNGYEVVAVVAHYEQSQSRRERLLEIKTIAEAYSIPLLLPDKASEVSEHLVKLQPEVGILVAYGRIIPQSIIDIFPKGIINIHPSLLPLHRGPTPIESVILEGARETGVSIMQLSKDMDAGDIFGYAQIDLSENETKQELANILLDVGSNLLIQLLPGIIDGSITHIPQDDSLATYDTLISKKDGVIDWSKPAEQLEREVRAYSIWPRSRAIVNGVDIIITKASVVSETGKPGSIAPDKRQLVVFCGKDALNIEQLIPASKKEMSGAAFIAGYALST